MTKGERRPIRSNNFDAILNMLLFVSGSTLSMTSLATSKNKVLRCPNCKKWARSNAKCQMSHFDNY